MENISNFAMDTIEFVSPYLFFLLSVFTVWLFGKVTGIIDGVQNNTIKSIILNSISFYYRQNIDDFIEKGIEERLDMVCEEAERRLKKRGIIIELDELCDMVFISLVEFHDNIENKYIQKESNKE